MATRNVEPRSRVERPEPASSGTLTTSEETADRETLSLVLEQARTGLDGVGALVHGYHREDGELRLIAVDGISAASAGPWAELPEGHDAAPAVAVRRSVSVWVGGDPLGIGATGTLSVSLPGADRLVGVLSVLTAGDGEPDEVHQSFLRTIARWAGVHLSGRPGAPLGHEPLGPERPVQMGELTSALAEAVTARDVIDAFASHVLPPFGADGLVFYALEADRLQLVGALGYPREFLRAAQVLPVSAHATILDVVGTRVPQFIESKADFLRRYPTESPLSELSPKEAWSFMPLVASGQVVGVCVVSFSEPHPFSDEERTLLTAVSGLVGQALERARLYDAEHARAQELQRGLLPRTLPRLPAVSAAARYLPAGRDTQVGGDWYDLIPLSADRVAMVIGDVMGHGITEAATMGRLRTAVRTLADLDMPPDELFGRLNDMVRDLGEDSYATCLYLVFDPVARTCSYSLAGHPPPIVVLPDGTLHSPDPSPDPPLGAACPPFDLHHLDLPEESLLVLCTDGLIESADRDVEQGLAQLRQTLSRAAARTGQFGPADQAGDVRRLEELCDTVVAALLPDREQTADDAGLLIAHTRCTDAGDVASCDLPEDPRAAGQARAYVRRQLADWKLDDLTLTTELLVSELVGNVVRHAKGPIRLRLLRSTSLTCEVYDGSLTTPRIQHATYTDEGGRGLQLVATLSRRWGARYLQDGKCIWVEQELPVRSQPQA
ncbi:hypothetical protein SGFS_013980 [Streptomyces graminofaciens]|uniref:Uncharacterized protein n=1 Tax=Streptomyces graminofaciens TaxID=68212 RepID=A0ABM7F2T1_9ACTN|nr:SpoIIE family protein phosphatase [Streptomyces graminofaciens]BBC30104.1 hypothetical protein SGFS_013980 [Streptomyces graminofaciens]